MTRLQYRLAGIDPDKHEFVVTLLIAGGVGAGLRLQLPAWIPGSYMIRDFARNITAIAANDRNGRVSLKKIDKQTWEVEDDACDLVITYRVYAFDLSVRSAYLDRTRAFFNGTSLFLRVPAYADAEWSLRLARPDGSFARDWSVATSLPATDVDGAGFGDYCGSGYAHLIDCPVEIGRQEKAQFEVRDIPHTVAISDGGRFDMARILSDLSLVCSEHADMFGGLPLASFHFLVLATGDGYGGLEHRDSTSLICKRADLPRPGLGKPDKGYRQFLGLCSHEYFHLWNVKRIRPAVLADADLSAEAHTELLWAFEGITSYYDELALARSGVLDPETYLDMFAATVTRVLRSPGRVRQSVAESSFDAWTKFYKQDENAPNAIVSYYTKGALVAFGLDMTLRVQSNDALSLDDVMRHLWQRYGARDRALAERAIEAEVAELLGQPLDDFFDRYVYGTDELPLRQWFAAVGIGLRQRAAENAEDQGGYRAEPASDQLPMALGARFESQPSGLRITQVLNGSAAEAAGLAAGDLLLAVDGERATAAGLAGLLARAANDDVRVHYFRRDRLVEDRLPVRAAALDTCDLYLLPEAGVDRIVRLRRANWLASSHERTQ